MIAGGMSWKQAIFTVFLGNVLVLVPMLLNAHAGAKYGIPFPVFARASFGVLGANVPAVLRALVACGWFGINTWIGGEAINAMVVALVPSWRTYSHGRVDLLWRLLAAARHRHRAGHPDDQVSARRDRAVPAGDRRGAARLGRGEGGRIRTDAGGAVQISNVRRIFPILHAVADRRSGILGHRGAEHSRFHALCAQPARASGRPGAGPCRRR